MEVQEIHPQQALLKVIQQELLVLQQVQIIIMLVAEVELQQQVHKHQVLQLLELVVLVQQQALMELQQPTQVVAEVVVTLHLHLNPVVLAEADQVVKIVLHQQPEQLTLVEEEEVEMVKLPLLIVVVLEVQE